MASGEGTNFQAIAEYFSDKDVDITCISDVENSNVLNRAKKLNIRSFYVPFESNIEFLRKNRFDLIALAGYMRILPQEVLELGKFINIHPSLLPAFKGKDAIKRSFLHGVKVGGVTVHHVEKEVDKGKIIAQLPILLDSTMHFDEYEKEIHKIEHFLYPKVIENILNDKVFDISDLLGGCHSSCHSGCSGDTQNEGKCHCDENCDYAPNEKCDSTISSEYKCDHQGCNNCEKLNSANDSNDKYSCCKNREEIGG